MADTYPETMVASQSDPAIGAVLIDYSGGNQTVSGHMRALYITTAGDLKVDTARGDIAVIHPFVVGPAPLKVTKIYQADSTAAGVIWY
jgi:hypothetical protein